MRILYCLQVNKQYELLLSRFQPPHDREPALPPSPENTPSYIYMILEAKKLKRINFSDGLSHLELFNLSKKLKENAINQAQSHPIQFRDGMGLRLVNGILLVS